MMLDSLPVEVKETFGSAGDPAALDEGDLDREVHAR